MNATRMLRAIVFGAVSMLAAGAALPGAAAEPDGGQRTAEGFGVERYMADSLLTARVKLALLDAPDVTALAIAVQTHGGVVQLSGFVDDERIVQRARDIASRVPGVVAVQNMMIIKG